MKLNILSTGLLAVCLTAYAAEGERQTGQVWLQGFVLDSSCTINMQDKYQRIEIPQVAATALYQRGYSPAFAFAVRLENCLLSADDKNLRITFTGPSDSNGLFAVSGGGRRCRDSAQPGRGFGDHTGKSSGTPGYTTDKKYHTELPVTADC
ncbi:fimbrial protein [Morganella morganii]|nr:fimbrial protein [Morganella morganii]